MTDMLIRDVPDEVIAAVDATRGEEVAANRMSAILSPMTTVDAMVLPVETRGIADASARGAEPAVLGFTAGRGADAGAGPARKCRASHTC